MSTCSFPHRKVSAAACCYRGVKTRAGGITPSKSHICLSSATFPRLLQPTKIPRLIPHAEQFGKHNPTPYKSSLGSSLKTLESWIWPALLREGSGKGWRILLVRHKTLPECFPGLARGVGLSPVLPELWEEDAGL